ncbi:MAG: hypothetical protein DI556_05410 [Rhodovulum sulfidophilum]|uniref:Lipoprotein n=1 Tax=Rhodovulum sulfidophilum TaxID=35806 RepID=A0A2W5NL90_RHOSU|nr:MAG: hypothetical protein DI556_05410 [Rhodovulum sulfidophilum]
MKRLLTLLLLAPLGACVQGDIPVPASGPGRQEAICAIAFSQWLGINSHDVRVTGRSAGGANAVVGLSAAEPRATATCEITPEYVIAKMTTE